MSNFKVGQKVVCVDNTGVELVKDKVYTVQSLSSCPGCEIPLITVGTAEYQLFARCTCGHVSLNEGQYKESRFWPLKQEPRKISNVIDNKQVIKELVTEKSDVKIKEKVWMK